MKISRRKTSRFVFQWKSGWTNRLSERWNRRYSKTQVRKFRKRKKKQWKSRFSFRFPNFKMVRRFQLGMFEKRNFARSVSSKSKEELSGIFGVLFSLSIRFLCVKVDHDADTSNFDAFPEDDSPEPGDDLTGWDKEFWNRSRKRKTKRRIDFHHYFLWVSFCFRWYSAQSVEFLVIWFLFLFFSPCFNFSSFIRTVSQLYRKNIIEPFWLSFSFLLCFSLSIIISDIVSLFNRTLSRWYKKRKKTSKTNRAHLCNAPTIDKIKLFNVAFRQDYSRRSLSSSISLVNTAGIISLLFLLCKHIDVIRLLKLRAALRFTLVIQYETTTSVRQLFISAFKTKLIVRR